MSKPANLSADPLDPARLDAFIRQMDCNVTCCDDWHYETIRALIRARSESQRFTPPLPVRETRRRRNYDLHSAIDLLMLGVVSDKIKALSPDLDRTTVDHAVEIATSALAILRGINDRTPVGHGEIDTPKITLHKHRCNGCGRAWDCAGNCGAIAELRCLACGTTHDQQTRAPDGIDVRPGS